ncbi:MAG: BREX system P-loop protein BrxC, partial [Bacteroidetes bacterium]|nr:BREX system P-loop protein BrxC [Bacteroidota bacterium]
RSTIRGEIQNAITLAEKNLDNEFAIRVLKALFLVKYYSNFKTTARNVSVLMIDDINVDLKKHEQKVQEALNILETQNYIQRNGDLYEFLTDDEKDIQEEIKSMEIDNQQVTQLLKEILFDEIIRDTRIRYLDNKQEYEYTSKIDGIILGRERELTIEIITPNFDDYGNESLFKAQTMGYNTLMMMVLPSDERLMKDMRMYLKTGKYIKQSRSTTNKDNIKQILYDKSQQNNERRQELVLILRKLLGEADVFLNGSKHEMISTSDGKTKVVKGFQDLIKIAYPSLRMLGKVVYTDDTIKSIIRSTQDDLFGTDDSAISEAESEILNLVVRRKKQSDRTSLQDIREHFSKKPYGWYANGIWSVTARLFKRGKIEIRQDANLLSDEEALDALLNTRTHNNTLLVPQMEVDPRHVRQLSEMYHKMFDEVCPAREAKDVANAFRDMVKSELVAINQLLASVENYPFLRVMEPLGGLLEKLADKEYAWLFTNVKEYEDELLDAKEDVLDPIKKFWHGEQKKIYDSIRIFIQDNQSNLEYIQSDELAKLKEVYSHSKPYSGNLIRDAKTARDTITQKVLDQIEAEKKSAIRVVERVIDVLKKNVEFEKLNNDKKVQVLKPFNEEIEKLREQRFIANIRQARERVENELLTTQLNEMVKLATPADTEKETHEPKVHYITRSTIKVNYPNSELRTEADVNEYVEALKKEFLKHIRENKRISL